MVSVPATGIRMLVSRTSVITFSRKLFSSWAAVSGAGAAFSRMTDVWLRTLVFSSVEFANSYIGSLKFWFIDIHSIWRRCQLAACLLLLVHSLFEYILRHYFTEAFKHGLSTWHLMGCLNAVIYFLTAVEAFASNRKEDHIYTPFLCQLTGLL